MTENTNEPGGATPPPPSGYEAPRPAAAAPPPPAYSAAPPTAAAGTGRGTNTMALVALIAGIGGFTFLPFVGSIVAVITGPMGEKQIATSGEDGAQLAKIGKILGWVGLALWVLGIIAFVIFWVIIAASAA